MEDRDGYVLVNKATGVVLSRPDRGSGGIAIWSDLGRAKRECGQDEAVRSAALVLTIGTEDL